MLLFIKRRNKVYSWVCQEGNVLFNDILNTFYLRLNGVGHMVELTLFFNTDTVNSYIIIIIIIIVLPIIVCVCVCVCVCVLTVVDPENPFVFFFLFWMGEWWGVGGGEAIISNRRPPTSSKGTLGRFVVYIAQFIKGRGLCPHPPPPHPPPPPPTHTLDPPLAMIRHLTLAYKHFRNYNAAFTYN